MLWLLLLLPLQARSTTVWCCAPRSLSATQPSSPHSAQQTAGGAAAAATMPGRTPYPTASKRLRTISTTHSSMRFQLAARRLGHLAASPATCAQIWSYCCICCACAYMQLRLNNNAQLSACIHRPITTCQNPAGLLSQSCTLGLMAQCMPAGSRRTCLCPARGPAASLSMQHAAITSR